LAHLGTIQTISLSTSEQLQYAIILLMGICMIFSVWSGHVIRFLCFLLVDKQDQRLLYSVYFSGPNSSVESSMQSMRLF